MFSGIKQERFGQLSTHEQRLLDNVKKAFCDSDELYRGGRAEDSLEPMCRAIDAAKTLRRSLRGEDASSAENARRFKEFIDLEVPAPGKGGLQLSLVDARTSRTRFYSFSDLVYAIRCMVHENENLNAAEQPDYHILLDWGQVPRWAPSTAGPVSGSAQDLSLNCVVGFHSGAVGFIDTSGRITLNGHFMWGRLREVLSKFITGIDAMIGLAKGAHSICMTIHPPLGSVRPIARQSG
jgi:hypothetical protein